LPVPVANDQPAPFSPPSVGAPPPALAAPLTATSYPVAASQAPATWPSVQGGPSAQSAPGRWTPPGKSCCGVVGCDGLGCRGASHIARGTGQILGGFGNILKGTGQMLGAGIHGLGKGTECLFSKGGSLFQGGAHLYDKVGSGFESIADRKSRAEWEHWSREAPSLLPSQPTAQTQPRGTPQGR
jgi:hypothetical protein